MRRFVAVDLETTGVNPYQDYIVEVGLAGESPHTGSYFEEEFSLDFPEEAMSAGAAAVNGWGKRQFAGILIPPAAEELLRTALTDVHIVGKNPNFDESFLRFWWNQHQRNEPVPWHHRMVDVGTLAWGSDCAAKGFNADCFPLPPNVEDVERMTGIMRETVRGRKAKGEYHSALCDARWAYQVFRSIVPKES